MPTAAQRQLSFNSLDDVSREVTALHEGGYEQLGDWALGQMCRHLAFPMNAGLEGRMNFKAPIMIRLLRPVIRRSFFTTRKIKPGLPAPPGTTFEPGDDAAAVEELRQAIQRVQQHGGPWPKHPFLGKLSGEQWREFHVIHAQHHLGFLEPK